MYRQTKEYLRESIKRSNVSNSRICHTFCSQGHKLQTGENFTDPFASPDPFSCPPPTYLPVLDTTQSKGSEEVFWPSERGESTLHFRSDFISFLLTHCDRLYVGTGQWELCEKQAGLGLEPCAGEHWSKALVFGPGFATHPCTDTVV